MRMWQNNWLKVTGSDLTANKKLGSAGPDKVKMVNESTQQN